MPFDLFISYSRRDNAGGRVTALKERIAADYRAFAGEELRCFFDLEDIHGMDDWRHRILQGLRESHLQLTVALENSRTLKTEILSRAGTVLAGAEASLVPPSG